MRTGVRSSIAGLAYGGCSEVLRTGSGIAAAAPDERALHVRPILDGGRLVALVVIQRTFVHRVSFVRFQAVPAA
jgi:hypothetical protein